METAKEYLENCEYISQDGDTVYIDEEALEECMEQYADQRVIEEVEKITSRLEKKSFTAHSIEEVEDRIKELKQE